MSDDNDTVYDAHYVGYTINNTDMHVTIAYSDKKMTENQIVLMKHAFENLHLQGRTVHIYGRQMLSGPTGVKDQVEAVRLILLDKEGGVDLERMVSMRQLSNQWSWRSNLDEQYDFQFHLTVGNATANPQEYAANQREISDTIMHGNLVLGQGYIKNMRTKKKTHFEH